MENWKRLTLRLVCMCTVYCVSDFHASPHTLPIIKPDNYVPSFLLLNWWTVRTEWNLEKIKLHENRTCTQIVEITLSYSCVKHEAQPSLHVVGNFNSRSFKVVKIIPRSGSPSEYCHNIWCWKTRIIVKKVRIRLLVSMQYKNVTDERIDGQTRRQRLPYA